MSTNYADSTRTLTGDFAAVKTATETVSPADLTADDEYERRIDTERLPDEYQAALEADRFILYGKASISQYDRGNAAEGQSPQKLEMDALENALDGYLNQGKAGGPVSYGHDDVIVGDVIESFELDDATEVTVGDETHHFDAGETLSTHVEDSDGDGRPEFWAVADLAKDTYFARKMRLLTMAGALDGFSVTVVPRAWEETDDGQRVTELDWHSTTIGTKDQILNSGSEFGVAAFKLAMSDATDGVAATFRAALLGAGDAGDGPAETPHDAAHQPTDGTDYDHSHSHGHDHDHSHDIKGKLQMGIMDNLFSASGIDPDLGRAASDAKQKAQTHDLSQKEAVTLTVNSDEFSDNDDVTAERLLDTMDGTDTDPDAGSEDDADADAGTDATPSNGDGDDEQSDSAGDMGGSGGDGGAGDAGQHADTSGDGDGDAQAAAATLANAMGDGVDAADVMAALETIEDTDADGKADDGSDGDGGDDDDNSDAGDDADQHAGTGAGGDTDEFVTEDELDEKLDGLRGNIVDDLSPKLESAFEDFTDDFAQHAATGGTSDPSGGPAETGRDLDSELDRIADEAAGSEA